MSRHRFAWIAVPVVLATAAVALAEEPATADATSDQVQQLEAQLDQMSKELEALKKDVNSSGLSPQQHQMMMGHMGRMEGHMHGMQGHMHGLQSECCMDAENCPGRK